MAQTATGNLSVDDSMAFVGDGGRRGGSDGVWKSNVLVGRPLTESRGVEQAGTH